MRAADHPIAAGMPAGSITDDTEQALLLAHALIDGAGVIDPEDFARRLAAWEDDMRARGSLDLLGSVDPRRRRRRARGRRRPRRRGAPARRTAPRCA